MFVCLCLFLSVAYEKTLFSLQFQCFGLNVHSISVSHISFWFLLLVLVLFAFRFKMFLSFSFLRVVLFCSESQC